MTWVAVAGAGVVGVLFRYLADVLAARNELPPHFATFCINMVGCFIAGCVFVLATERSLLNETLGRALAVGFCGGFTTFSAYALQSALMLERGQIASLAAYFAVSPLLGLVSAYAGLIVTRSLMPAL